MFVIGTAGHVDHGKSTLVKALTGIDPDRLAEEKLREMTIELGFAWLRLPGGREVGVVDVPGHEHFIKNMLAGVSGMDLVMLIVAANESIKQQTREHLAILDLMEVPALIAVITQADLADSDQIALVGMEIDDLLKPTQFAGSPVVPVSAVSGQGLEELKKTIEKALNQTQPKRDIGKPRLPVDRVFTIAGSGTVVTGTLVDGSLSVGQEIEIQPGELKSRIRSLQTHKNQLNRAEPGSRVAVNLVGLSPDEIKRGQVLTRPGWITPTSLIDAKLRLLALPDRPLKHDTQVSLHCGSAETMARIRVLDKEAVRPGETTYVQLVLDEPLAVVNNDRYVIRSPQETLGGGSIIEAHPGEKHRRFKAETIENLKIRGEGLIEAALLAALKSKQPQERSLLAAQSNLEPQLAQNMIDELINNGSITALGEGGASLLFTDKAWKQVAENMVAMVRDYHRKYPLRLGIPRAEIGSKVKLGAHFNDGLQKLAGAGLIAEENALVRLAGHQVNLTKDQQFRLDGYLKQLGQNPFSPSPDINLEGDLLNLLIERGQVVKTLSGVVFSASAFTEMTTRIMAKVKENGKITLAEVRDMFQSSRKYTLAVLEYLDEKKVTRRVGDDRVAGEKSGLTN
ncbi:MAG TPA: selenocysteine-specific translation elongation factor [Dehalococcoidales bacterium]|nr:selenocysteine-specific translation elongation factor [Dehalococcoidales bacterium]